MTADNLQASVRALLEAAAAVDAAGEAIAAPPAGEWNAEQILAHVAIVNAATIATAAAIAAGTTATYDNRIAHDPWTIEHIISIAGGTAGLQERIRHQGDALSALCGPALSSTELDTMVPTVLVSHGLALVNQALPLRDLLTGLAESELPGHTQQLLSLLPQTAETVAG